MFVRVLNAPSVCILTQWVCWNIRRPIFGKC